MRCSCATSASRGTLSRISVSSDNRPAIINGSAAFFAPEIGMVPLSLLPPTMRIRSILIPAFAVHELLGERRPDSKSFEICGDLMGLSNLDRRSPVYSCRSADAPTRPGLLQFYQAPAPVAAKRRFGYTGA